MRDKLYISRCLELAKLGLADAAPNPSVGCIIVRDDVIIGEGYTSKYGGNHAEVNAVDSVQNKELIRESTVYVSLEPCSHFGNTPPCSDLLVSLKPKRVVIACIDPFAKVNGMGIKKLRESGIQVDVGILKSEAEDLNRRFFTFHQKKRPYIILKWGETKNGFLDDSSDTPLKITCDTSNKLVHKWRATESAILIGKNTAIKDNPTLTTRNFNGKNPIRILLDSNLETPISSNIYNTEAQTIVVSKVYTGHPKEATQLNIPDTRNLEHLLEQLHRASILSVIVEGGPTIHKAFYDSGYWDEIRRFVSPFEIESGVSAITVSETPCSEETIGVDTLYRYINE